MSKAIINKFGVIIFISIFCVACYKFENKNADITKTVPTSEKFIPHTSDHSDLAYGELVYIPVYSSIYNQYEENLLHMTAILSIRNISPENSIIITKVEYYDTNGKLIKNYIDHSFSLDKMSSKDFVIPESDLSGGVGANFLVEWKSTIPLAAPIMESIMLGTVGTKAFSFSSRGKKIKNIGK